MTERTASGRAQGALKAIGMDETPVSVLERDDALFVLTARTLVYQDGGGTRRVTLRDLTRIHSDEQGVLRVETPAGTALTASLLGFDVAQVQAFFAQVRDTTARAKEQPAAPLPTPGGLKTFGAPPAAADTAPAGSPPQPAPVRPAAEPPPLSPARTAPALGTPPATPDAPAPAPAAVSPAPAPVRTAPPETATPPAPAATRPVAEAPAARPVVISSSAFTPSAARTPTLITEPPRAPERPAPAVPTPVQPAPTPATPAAQTPVPVTLPAPRLDELARQADAVEGLTGRLRFLGGVLFVGALALAVVQFLSGARLDGLWTLLSGGVGTIALLALADMARLLVLSARARRSADGSDDR
ncbi:hypothetical protein HNQ07_002851 [Deinococcus metalli]|nr:hypothetical protein [Deinococcus metalli]MBB5377359.1 hypothetical protein [Deinococcus metalli]